MAPKEGFASWERHNSHIKPQNGHSTGGTSLSRAPDCYY